MDAVVGISAAIVSVSTLLFGYFKLVRDDRIQLVQSEIELWETRVKTLEGERQLLKDQLDELREKVEKLGRLVEEYERERELLMRAKLELLDENRRLRAERE